MGGGTAREGGTTARGGAGPPRGEGTLGGAAERGGGLLAGGGARDVGGREGGAPPYIPPAGALEEEDFPPTTGALRSLVSAFFKPVFLNEVMELNKAPRP